MSDSAKTDPTKSRCRCGHPDDSTEPHPCHGNVYTCRKPATQRFYGLHLACLAGMQFKMGASDTYACDECWAEFSAKRKEARP